VDEIHQALGVAGRSSSGHALARSINRFGPARTVVDFIHPTGEGVAADLLASLS